MVSPTFSFDCSAANECRAISFPLRGYVPDVNVAERHGVDALMPMARVGAPTVVTASPCLSTSTTPDTAYTTGAEETPFTFAMVLARSASMLL